MSHHHGRSSRNTKQIELR